MYVVYMNLCVCIYVYIYMPVTGRRIVAFHPPRALDAAVVAVHYGKTQPKILLTTPPHLHTSHSPNRTRVHYLVCNDRRFNQS